ncbi:MAG: hypothetical protein RIF41_07855 [Polyangiaceae bacterium]
MGWELHPADRIAVRPDAAHRDYILTPYEPPADPTGGLEPESLLRAMLRERGMLDGALPVIGALQEALGRDETVWGAKYGPSGFSVELYFYNFTQNEAGNPKSVTALKEALAPSLRFGSALDESKPYFMCSFEISEESLARGDGGHFRIYCRTGDEARREAGFSYRVEGSELVLENHYWFYEAAKTEELEDAVRRVVASPRSGAKPCWSVLLPKYLRECHTICYAVKPRHDSLYYSRIRTGQLARFLSRHGHAPLAALLREHERDFAHLVWDLGFDFCAAPSAESLTIDKLGIHGIF